MGQPWGALSCKGSWFFKAWRVEKRACHLKWWGSACPERRGGKAPSTLVNSSIYIKSWEYCNFPRGRSLPPWVPGQIPWGLRPWGRDEAGAECWWWAEVSPRSAKLCTGHLGSWSWLEGVPLWTLFQISNPSAWPSLAVVASAGKLPLQDCPWDFHC